MVLWNTVRPGWMIMRPMRCHHVTAKFVKTVQATQTLFALKTELFWLLLYLNVYMSQNQLWNCTHFRHPTDEQLRHVDIFFSNYYNLQSVYFEYLLSQWGPLGVGGWEVGAGTFVPGLNFRYVHFTFWGVWPCPC